MKHMQLKLITIVLYSYMIYAYMIYDTTACNSILFILEKIFLNYNYFLQLSFKITNKTV